MPTADWGLDRQSYRAIDRFRSEFEPYDGPPPPNAVYLWQVKRIKYTRPQNGTYPQLVIDLVLEPRRTHEQEYAGYFIRVYRSITPRSVPFYAPFLQAIGVSASDFGTRTVYNRDTGDIQRIGQVQFTDHRPTYVRGALRDDNSLDNDGNPRARKDVTNFMPAERTKQQQRKRSAALDDFEPEDDIEETDDPWTEEADESESYTDEENIEEEDEVEEAYPERRTRKPRNRSRKPLSGTPRKRRR